MRTKEGTEQRADKSPALVYAKFALEAKRTSFLQFDPTPPSC